MKETIVKAYESEEFNQALEESLHPGGLDLTERLADLADITNDSMVLDIASGRGTTACFLAQSYGCFVHGIDLSHEAIRMAREKASAKGVSSLIHCHLADAEDLPFEEDFFDIVVCECSFSLMPDKPKAAAEIVRVLKPGGRLALTDMFLKHSFSDELKTLVPFDCCFTGAKTLEGYEKLFRPLGLEQSVFEDHSFSLYEITDKLRGEYGSLQAFWDQFGSGTKALCSCDSGSEGCTKGYGTLWKRVFQEGQPGYCLMIWEKS